MKKFQLLETLEKYYKEGWLIKQTHPELPLTIWNYSQTTQYEGKWDEVTLMCRGLVTYNETGEIVARPFKKFFNLEENKHTPTKDFEVYNKMDGSLIIAFQIYGSWILASRGSFTSEQAQAASKLFHKQYGSMGMNSDTTYLFEYTSPWNRIVVDYGDKEELTLLGGIRTEDGLEAPWYHLSNISKLNGIPLVKKYDGITDYIILKRMIGNNEEGFVIKFSNGDRMKVKGEEYLRLHRIMTGVSTTSVWDVLANGGNMEEVLKNVPDEFYDKIKEVEFDLKMRFTNIQKDYFQYYLDITNRVVSTDRKAFAEEAKKYPHPSILFAILNGKSVEPIIWKIVKPKWEKL
jgi:T4 RnlA family RNA ligase